MHVRHAPAMFDQFDRQPVEQLRMDGERPLATKVEDRRNERPPHVPRPDMVHSHAGRERILGIGDPLRESCSPASTGLREWLATRLFRFQIVLQGLERTDQRRVCLTGFLDGGTSRLRSGFRVVELLLTLGTLFVRGLLERQFRSVLFHLSMYGSGLLLGECSGLTESHDTL